MTFAPNSKSNLNLNLTAHSAPGSFCLGRMESIRKRGNPVFNPPIQIDPVTIL